jgi:hypothetical protein
MGNKHLRPLHLKLWREPSSTVLPKSPPLAVADQQRVVDANTSTLVNRIDDVEKTAIEVTNGPTLATLTSSVANLEQTVLTTLSTLSSRFGNNNACIAALSAIMDECEDHRLNQLLKRTVP